MNDSIAAGRAYVKARSVATQLRRELKAQARHVHTFIVPITGDGYRVIVTRAADGVTKTAAVTIEGSQERCEEAPKWKKRSKKASLKNKKKAA